MRPGQSRPWATCARSLAYSERQGAKLQHREAGIVATGLELAYSMPPPMMAAANSSASAKRREKIGPSPAAPGLATMHASCPKRFPAPFATARQLSEPASPPLRCATSIATSIMAARSRDLPQLQGSPRGLVLSARSWASARRPQAHGRAAPRRSAGTGQRCRLHRRLARAQPFAFAAGPASQLVMLAFMALASMRGGGQQVGLRGGGPLRTMNFLPSLCRPWSSSSSLISARLRSAGSGRIPHRFHGCWRASRRRLRSAAPSRQHGFARPGECRRRTSTAPGAPVPDAGETIGRLARTRGAGAKRPGAVLWLRRERNPFAWVPLTASLPWATRTPPRSTSPSSAPWRWRTLGPVPESCSISWSMSRWVALPSAARYAHAPDCARSRLG